MSEANQRKKERIKLDQIMRVLFGMSKKTMVPLLNGLFDERHEDKDVTIRYGNGKFTDDALGRIEGDLFLTVHSSLGREIVYHIEFQTENDGSMVVRMFRYGFEKALERSRIEGTGEQGNAAGANRDEEAAMPVIEFPRQLVIFLEENRRIGDTLSFRLRLPDGQEVVYRVPALKLWLLTSEQLKERSLYALLPLQVFRLRKRMQSIADSVGSEADKSQAMAEAFEELKATIRRTLDAFKEAQEEARIGTGDLDRMLRVLHNITEYLYNRYERYDMIEEEVRQMIKTWIDPRVKAEGRREGREVGIKEGKEAVARNLLSLGADMEMVVKATGLSQEELQRLLES